MSFALHAHIITKKEAASAEANYIPAVILESIHKPIAQVCPAKT